MKWLAIALSLLWLAGCSTGGSSSGSGRYAIKQDHGPKSAVNLDHVKDAVPRSEAKSRGGNRSPYKVLGKVYYIMPSSEGYTARGTASWYGKKFHGHLTSNGEVYDMYAMSAAHKSLPLPTFLRVTNEGNGRQVIVRVNDRGPFHGNRLIDLSYAAAYKLDMLKTGTARVRIEAITSFNTPMETAEVSAVAKAADTGMSIQAVPAAAITPIAPTNVVKPVMPVAKPLPVIAKSSLSVVDKPLVPKGAVVHSGFSSSLKSIAPPVITTPKKRTNQHDITDRMLQVAALSQVGKAQAVRKQVERLLDLPVKIVEINRADRTFFRILAGPLPRSADVQSLKDLLAHNGYPGSHVVDLADSVQ